MNFPQYLFWCFVVVVVCVFFFVFGQNIMPDIPLLFLISSSEYEGIIGFLWVLRSMKKQQQLQQENNEMQCYFRMTVF